MSQVSNVTPAQSGTSTDASGQENREGPILGILETITPQEMPGDSSCCLEQLYRIERGDSRQDPATDHESGTNLSHEGVRHIQDTNRCRLPYPWNLRSVRTNLPFRNLCRDAAQAMRSSTHYLESRREETRFLEFNPFPSTGGARRAFLGLDLSEGSLFCFGALVPMSFLRSGCVRDSQNARINAVESILQIATNSSILSILHGNLQTTISGEYLPYRQSYLLFYPRSQRPPTAAAVSPFARLTATQHGGLRAHAQVSSERERFLELRHRAGAFGGSVPLSSVRATLEFYLPSRTSGTRLMPARNLSRELHGPRRFGGSQLSITLPRASSVQPRAPLSLPSSSSAPLPLRDSPSTLQELARRMFPTNPEAEGNHLPANLREQIERSVHRGLRQSEIDNLRSYPLDPEVNEQISCVVCISIMENGEVVRVLPCEHEFHAACVDEWLRTNRTCPLCRQDASVEAPPSAETT